MTGWFGVLPWLRKPLHAMAISTVMIGLINTAQEWPLSKKVCWTKQTTMCTMWMDHDGSQWYLVSPPDFRGFGSHPSCWIPEFWMRIFGMNHSESWIFGAGTGGQNPLRSTDCQEPPQPRWHWHLNPENPRWIPKLNVESHSHNSFPSAIPILLLCVAKKPKYSKFLYGGFQKWGKPPVLIQFFRGFSMKPSSHWGSQTTWATSALWFEWGLGFHPSKGWKWWFKPMKNLVTTRWLYNGYIMVNDG